MKYRVQTEIQVRFSDLDSMGHVNNAKYFTYFEQARIAYFKNFPSLDFTSSVYNPSTSIIVASIKCDFKTPAFLDETLIVKIKTNKMGRSSFMMSYEIVEKHRQRQIATGESAMVYFDYKKSKSLEIPNNIRKQFEEIERQKF